MVKIPQLSFYGITKIIEFTHSNEDDELEVVYGLLESMEVSIEDFEKVRLAKKEERGVFREKL
ncbi:hypothetical protein [Paenibacillus qinlingensis]|uniref:House-cleaning noncanonical NTP pyrophosphatase (MazG superfamily) n=1 Tax=Paenibacillus qinlingensis TaxID=1837343 RepID=A0ABU1NWQ6_9BACL|nr:hypothetical protein [Paenibacillus qinlingensis]MDR6551913.1 putative house-cleaning noncanonical NTP pyrophosphatase (MazG superfamily) [Paenibacillus qinlingensis]